MSLSDIKEKLIKAIEENREEIIQIGEHILKNPEMGYCEEKTSEFVRKKFDELGIEYEYPYAITGVKAKLKGRSSKYNVCIIGEMDALKCKGHPFSDSNDTAHACGHNTQIAGMLGVAIALSKSQIMKELDGDITLMAVPAEEFIDLAYRKSLKEEGKIKYFGGKQQMVYEGAFDDVDIAMMIHSKGDEPTGKLYSGGGSLGFVAKNITFRGKAVHGSMPFDGVNALNAAALAILGIHSNRETFREEEQIRIHPIITKGGSVVNSVPDEVCMETYIRGATLEAVEKGNRVVERAIIGAAQIMGATVDFETIPGYLPMNNSRELSSVFEACSKEIIGEENVIKDMSVSGSSDIGDISCLLPTIQPCMGGFCGGIHMQSFTVNDNEAAYILPAKLMATTAAELLYDNAQNASNVKKAFVPSITKKEYIKYLEGEK